MRNVRKVRTEYQTRTRQVTRYRDEPRIFRYPATKHEGRYQATFFVRVDLGSGLRPVEARGSAEDSRAAYEHDAEFAPETSNLVYGPINKPRWIYACSKQLMDRVIHAYGMEQGLNYTLFRPFNWIGSGLDSIFETKEGSSRVVTQFLGQIVRGENIQLVDGGAQKRAFADISDGVSALMRIIANEGGVASGRIFNIGNPANDHSVRELAEMMLAMAADYPEYAAMAQRTKIVETSSGSFYGKGYQDVQNRLPKIADTMQVLGWAPQVDMQTALRRIFESYREHVVEARSLTENAS
ncbi:MAG: hypothetical protein ABT20_04495 [Rubrivivax sp. SCN 70-15]|nr:MAG: hypothetical protein ABT20_04495 [Rubrivivax sp. SCN 70-15]